MRGPHNIWRLIRTGATLERTGAMNIVLDAMDAPMPLRVVAKGLCWPFQWLGFKGDTSMPPATRALTALGPAYIKLGQVLSTRPDVVGDELAIQLRVLQDKLPPFSLGVARQMVEEELDITLTISSRAFPNQSLLPRLHRFIVRRCTTRVKRSQSKSCDPISNVPFAKTLMRFISQPKWSRCFLLPHGASSRSM